MAKVMLLVLFAGGIFLVIIGIVIAVDARGSHMASDSLWTYSITGWIAMAAGLALAVGSTLTAVVASLIERSRR